MQQLVFGNCRFIFQEKKTTISFSITIYKTCDTMTFPRNIYSARWYADRKMLIEATMEEMDEVFLKSPLGWTECPVQQLRSI